MTPTTDAERFQWLERNCGIDATYCDVVWLSFPLPESVEGFNTLAEAIDAAMSLTQETPK